MNTSFSCQAEYKTNSKDLLLACMTSLARYLQGLARDQSWSSWVNGKEWRNRLDGPALGDVPLEELDDYLARKLDYCSIVFDLERPEGKEKDISTKEATLEDICDYISCNGSVLSGSMQVDIMEMVAKNIFRIFPPPLLQTESVVDDISEYLDPGWPHLSLVYHAALNVLERPDFDPHVLRKVINKQFLANLFVLFTSPDARERDYLKTILHRVYGMFLNLRSYIRNSMNNIFLTLIHEKTEVDGIAELLEVMGAIIKGLAVPLKPEHFELMHKILIPLYSAPGYLSFCAQLSYCIVQLVSKDPLLSVPTVKGLLRSWPLTDSAREVLILHQLEELLSVIPKDQFLLVQLDLFNQVGRCVASQHFQVAERALQMWGNTIFKEHIRESMPMSMPILLPYIFSSRQSHWNLKVIELSETVLEMMDQIDQEDMENMKLY